MRSEQPPPRWATGFWFWPGSSAFDPAVEGTLDVLFFHAGIIHKPLGQFGHKHWSVYGELPDELPSAREYWAVFRFEAQSVPDLEAAPILAQQVLQLRQAARRRQLTLAGVQLDIDSPTGKLSQYASFLREVKKGLPADTGLSITALLDWFRDGTAVSDVIREVDEFVPQFYDVAPPDSYRAATAVAKKIDPAVWGPRFSRFGKRFRVGASTFGRAQMIRAESRSRLGHLGILWHRDLTPLDIALNPVVTLQTARNEAGELVLSYRANRGTRIGFQEIERGDGFQFILPTPESVHTAVESARKMGGDLAGVVFFRWPGADETLGMEPNAVLMAAGLVTGTQRQPGIDLVDGHCAAVSCVDVFLVNARLLAPKPVLYKIQSSTELQYFLPEEGMPIRMTGPSHLKLSLPPYCGRRRMHLGRAVTSTRAVFRIEGEQ